MKKFFALLFMGILALSLTACGGQVDTEKTDTKDSVGEQSAASYDADDPNSILAAVTAECAAVSQNIADISLDVLEKIGDTYDDYDKNKTAITDFYNNSLGEANALYNELHLAGIDYFKCVAAQGVDDYDSWNNAMEEFYNTWERGMDDFYDAWDRSYDDVYDKCSGLIEGASSDLEYEEYSDVWSKMYNEHSDAWSAIYDAHSDAWSQMYDDYSDAWSGFYDGETDVDAILKQEKANTSNSEETETPSVTSQEIDSSNEELVDGMHPEFKEAMDSYEAFYTEYCDFLKDYQENPSDLTLIAKYADMVAKAADMDESFSEWDQDEMNAAELEYYLEVQSRVAQKISELS